MNQFLTSIISLFIVAVHFEHCIISPICLSIAYAITPSIKYNTQIAVGVYSLTYLYNFDSLLLLSFVEVVKSVADINFICQRNTMHLLTILRINSIFNNNFLILYMFGLGMGIWLAFVLDSVILFYVTIYLYPLVFI